MNEQSCMNDWVMNGSQDEASKDNKTQGAIVKTKARHTRTSFQAASGPWKPHKHQQGTANVWNWHAKTTMHQKQKG
jgi:hypothetical protein